MAKPTGRDVILKVCEHHRGDPPEVLAPAIMTALKGHGLAIIADPTTAGIAYCGGECYRVQLQSGRCPVCGWTPSTRQDPTEQTRTEPAP